MYTRTHARTHEHPHPRTRAPGKTVAYVASFISGQNTREPLACWPAIPIQIFHPARLESRRQRAGATVPIYHRDPMHPAIGYDDENPLIIFRTITRTLYDWHLMLELARRFEGCAEHLRSAEQLATGVLMPFPCCRWQCQWHLI